jgi:hypothetical protein
VHRGCKGSNPIANQSINQSIEVAVVVILRSIYNCKQCKFNSSIITSYKYTCKLVNKRIAIGCVVINLNYANKNDKNELHESYPKTICFTRKKLKSLIRNTYLDDVQIWI